MTAEHSRVTIDGNEAAVDVAYRLGELCAIYPITPSSSMAELADEWSSLGRTNIWGSVPTVIEMQSEGGAAGALHGALQAGALSTTFTASQGLLLMIPNMYKIAGELTSTVLHVAARSLAAQGLSIFGDHQDVMAVRQTGFALLSSASVQEAHDFALIAQAATLRSRVPFVHFFDGFRTSHELNTITRLPDEVLRAVVPEQLVRDHRARALSPERPFIRGTAQNPDVYFQARETVNPYYAAVPGLVQSVMDEVAEHTGRHYGLVEYAGHPEADEVVVIMGSGSQTVTATVAKLTAQGRRVGVLTIRLYRPFPAEQVVASLPASVRAVAVLDRTKEPGAGGDPLYLDVVAALAESWQTTHHVAMPRVFGGRYGLSSKEFTPAMVAGVFDALAADTAPPRFTVGIDDDVSGTSIDPRPDFDLADPETFEAVFFGLGSDGTVGANKNTIKILGNHGLQAQGYFVYDSKKSGGYTVSHLRFGPHEIKAPYLIKQADFVGCHQSTLLEQLDVVDVCKPGGTLLLSTTTPPDEVFGSLPEAIQRQIRDRRLSVHVINAEQVARDAGLPGRTNTVLQTCFFAISGVLPRDEAIAAVKAAITKTYAKRGVEVVARNEAAVDATLDHLHQLVIPTTISGGRESLPIVPLGAPRFVQDITATMMRGRGDTLPVSALPVDGTWPSGTTAYEKRRISDTVAQWDPQACIQCGNCAFVCPHAVLRAKFYDQSLLEGAPESFEVAPLNAAGLPDSRYTLQVYTEDCTGCGLCVEACPITAIPGTDRKAINLTDEPGVIDTGAANVEFFETLAFNPRHRIDLGTVRGAQFLQPLFEFSGACAGCGETPYLKLLTQLFGDRLTVANATGCSSIYGGNLPTTPWASNDEGRGPAWSNSLFEDNAEFGLGMRLAADLHASLARRRLSELREVIGADLVDAMLECDQQWESQLRDQHARLAQLRQRLTELAELTDHTGVEEGAQRPSRNPTDHTGVEEGAQRPSRNPTEFDVDRALLADLASVAEHLVRRSVWIVGGDGWAYDIGSGGLDHVLASGRDVNVLVLDTEVYSNTGGQSSKSTPLAAVAKFASAGKTAAKKDLALQAIAYGSVYVARVALGADPQQTLRAFREAEAYNGPSLIIAYSHCIAHGIEMNKGLDQQTRAVRSGHWPLVRYDPTLLESGENPFMLDSPRPTIELKDYIYRELRYRSLVNAAPAEAERLLSLAQEEVNQRWATYEEMATRSPNRFLPDPRKKQQWT